jgi:methionyl-tRNA synthetase
VLLHPFLPGTANKIYQQLALEGSPNRFEFAAWGGLPFGHQVNKPIPLFPRKDLPAPK